MADGAPCSLRSSYSAFSDLLHLLDKIPQPTCEIPHSGCDRCRKASYQLEDLRKDALYIQMSLEKLGKFKRDLGVNCLGDSNEVDRDLVDKPLNIHQIARAVQHFKNQLPSASYYRLHTINYSNDDHPGTSDDSQTTGIGWGYFDLDLQQKNCLWCFLVFPENEEIKKRILINWWIGEGFVTGVGLESIGKRILDELQTKQLIKQVQKKKRSTDCWQMDPAVRSFLIGKGKEDMFFDLDRKILDGKPMVLKSYLNVGSIDGVVNPVLTVFNVSKPTIGVDEAKSLASMQSLKVLHLGRSLLQHEVKIEQNNLQLITKNVFTMRSLKLLSFQGVSSLRELPVPFVFLSSLMVLDLRACRALESLHRNIGKMRTLRHLDMSGCHLLLQIPIEINRLYNLEVLKGFVIGSKPRSCTLGHLGKMEHLHKLSLYVIRKDFPTHEDMLRLANIKGLIKLKIIWNPAGIENSEGSSSPVSAQQQLLSLGKLEKLDLWCSPVYAAQHFLAPSRFPMLTQLNIRGAESIIRLHVNNTEDAAVETWNVKILRLRFLPNLEMTWEEKKGLFPELSYLEVQDCPKLQFSSYCDEEGVWVKPEIPGEVGLASPACLARPPILTSLNREVSPDRSARSG